MLLPDLDLLGDVLTDLQQESVVFCHAELTAPWGFAKVWLEGAPFHAITTGQAWVGLDGEAGPRELGPGDFFVLPHGDAHTLLGEPGTATVLFTEVLAGLGTGLWRPGMRCDAPIHLVHGGGGAPTTIISGVFAFRDKRRNPLVATLPRVIHVRGAEGRAVPWLETTLRYLAEEAASGRPGATAVSAKLADILFIQAVRAQLSLYPADTSGWLRGMTDAPVARALALMHRQPERHWTVALLAEQVGVSRSGFAGRFRTLVGQGPIEYLTQWRMYEAAGALMAGNCTLVDVAESAGYQSEVAFAKAFKRWSGHSPGAYRRTGRNTGGPASSRDA